MERIGYGYGYGYIIIHDLILLCGLFPVFPFFLPWYLGQVKARFAQWMQSSSITTSPNLDILPDAEGEGRCVVCTNDLEKGALICNESLGGSKTIHKTSRLNAVGGELRFIKVFYGVSRMLCWVCKGFLRISR